MNKSLLIKMQLLANGVKITESVINNYGLPYLEKRRAYGNQDPKKFQDIKVPQELYILPDNLIVAINIKDESPWELSYKNDKYFISNGETENEVSFPLRPEFYDYELDNGKYVRNYVTLYGGNSLGIFVNGNCHLIYVNKGCHYCSLYQNRGCKSNKNTNDFELIVKEDDFVNSLTKCFHDKTINVNQIMINGGNFSDCDYGFKYYLNLAKKALNLVKKYNMNLEVHLIVAPPTDLNLLKLLDGLDIKIAINTEVYNEKLFNEYCPGKVIYYPHKHIYKALKMLIDILGKNRVYSIMVGGLESLESTKNGISYLASIGVVPVINIFHNDPGTFLENKKPPNKEYIFEIGKILQDIYKENSFTPFYLNCGRNSIDTEAYKNLFIK